MKKVLFLVLLSCFVSVNQLVSQELDSVQVLKYEELESKISAEKGRLLVVNFWATWCAPCVAELPYFMRVQDHYGDRGDFKLLLVSLDRAKDLALVQDFIIKNKITAEVVILDDIKRMNTWIPRYDVDWQGEIPVTVFYKDGKKVLFHGSEIGYEELDQLVKKQLNIK